mmetsp:Transcript_21551/g.31320  ORF Transcript_21551/g.31320 Transcript_21551/m.31320 type:complete len:363 (+) Transcript_21551:149-1237(+)|eukprot:CAMPEP_0185036006 /NCGR_PEP_ID=MMETSP1103-20130426/28330_1 /TAXON_ID=36769 /ORGANISM="Paraphysomonas bandaiensis, Strain Caron Lab Isolate" /LENGTH=362 /DNA_ID=CAMNT_0027573353 /DNA_START=103 /DNA_END=1191 /DNA_ORIENTATION=-
MSSNRYDASPDEMTTRNVHLRRILIQKLTTKLGALARGNEKWIVLHVDDFMSKQSDFSPEVIDNLERTIRYNIHASGAREYKIRGVTGPLSSSESKRTINSGDRTGGWMTAPAEIPEVVLSTLPQSPIKSSTPQRQRIASVGKHNTKQKQHVYQPPVSIQYRPPRQKYNQNAPYLQQYERYISCLKAEQMPKHKLKTPAARPPRAAPECVKEYFERERLRREQEQDLQERRQRHAEYEKIVRAREEAEEAERSRKVQVRKSRKEKATRCKHTVQECSLPDTTPRPQSAAPILIAPATPILPTQECIKQLPASPVVALSRPSVELTDDDDVLWVNGDTAVTFNRPKDGGRRPFKCAYIQQALL